MTTNRGPTTDPTTTRREVLRKAWVFPAILTLPVLPSFAKAGSQVPSDGDAAGEWTVVPVTSVGTTASQFWGPGTYIVYPDAKTYLKGQDWTYVGVYGQVTMPVGFPVLTLGTDPIAVVPGTI